MGWVFNSKRTRGSRETVPHTDFYIGQVLIGRVSMHWAAGRTWTYQLQVPGHDPSNYDSFSDALRELHRLLNAAPPADHTIP